MNRSKDLRGLFRQHLINERKRLSVGYTNYAYGTNTGYGLNNIHRIPNQYGDNCIKIFFYEWSDLNRSPRMFYQLDFFDDFLRSSGIHMEIYQKEIIKNLGTVFVTCYTGTKNLNIRSTYHNLLEALRDYDAKKLLYGNSQNLIGSQKMLSKNDGTFFG